MTRLRFGYGVASTDVTDGSLQRLTQTPYNCAPIGPAAIRSEQLCSRPYF